MSRTARDLSIRTPGAPAEAARPIPTPEETAAEEAALEAEIAAGANEPAKPPVDAAPPAGDKQPTSMAELQAYIADEIKKGIAAGIREIKRAQLKQTPAASAELPDQSEVDPTKIREMTLTKQGYVLPAKYGQVPEHIRTQIQLGQSH